MNEIETRDARLSISSAVAREILRVGEGGRMPTNVALQERFHVGSGTVQRALRELEWMGCARLRARGHLGTIVEEWDLPRLWEAANMGPVHILLPAYGSREFERLAELIATGFATVGATCTVGYLTGAHDRMTVVTEGRADIALMSSGAAEAIGVGDAPTVVTEMLEENSYYAQGSLIVVSRETRDPRVPLRVGIDRRSHDHTLLTLAEFDEDSVEFVETDFRTLPREIATSALDAGVWHAVDTLIPLEAARLRLRGLENPEALAIARTISSAVLVSHADGIVGALLHGVLAAAEPSSSSSQRPRLRVPALYTAGPV